MTSTTVPRLFALVIGINEYKELPKLSGAVADANAIIDYLSSKTSASRIRSLKDEQATRQSIIEAFKTLNTSEAIKKNDPMLIYFAGHGGIARIKGQEEMTQMILSYDTSRRKKNKDELPVIKGIPDFEIRKLLNNIAVEKGNNITVIFDCCYSGHGTRRYTERRADVPLIFPVERGSSLPKDYIGKDLWSHVLLSACKPDQVACESPHNGSIRGHFTVALLQLLEEAGLTITYNELCKRLLGIPDQHPQCEGYNQNRLLFKPEKRPSQFEVFYKDQIILMEGGAAHGVTGEKEEFLVSDGPSTFSLTIEKVYSFYSEMKSPKGMPWPFGDRILTAFQKVPGEKARLRLYIHPDSNGRDIILSKLSEFQHLFLCTNTMKDASLVLQLNSQGRVHFTVTDPRVTDQGLSKLDQDVLVDNLESVIRAAQHYHWHLLRENPDFSFPDDTGVDSMVTLDFYKLQQPYTSVMSIGDPIEKVINGQDVIVKVVADDRTCYGIELKNKTAKSFYPYLFFFDNSDLSIQPYFLPPFGLNHQVIPPLMPERSLTIGYSNNNYHGVHLGGSGAFVYECRPGQDVDVGFLKLFLSNQYIDLSNLLQDDLSNLLQGVDTALDEGNIRRTMVLPQARGGPEPTWVSMVVTVVQESLERGK